MHRSSALMPLLLSIACFCACHQAGRQPAKPDFLAQDIDSTVNPADDFFSYANGGWIKKTPIPEDESGWGIGYLVQEEIYNRLKKVNLDAQAANAAEGAITRKIGDFWFSGMDTTGIDRQGLAPLQPELDRIAAIKTKTDLLQVVADMHTKGIGVMFADGAGQDDKNSDQMAYELWQGGLGMPNRDYYFKTDERTAGIRKAYQAYMITTFRQLGADSTIAAKKMNAVYALETRIAKASRKLVDLRDPYRNYNKMTLAGLKKLSDNIDWDLFLQQIGVHKLDSAIIGQPEFYTALNREIGHTPIDDWKDYLRFYLVHHNAPYLDSQTYHNAFVYAKVLTGAEEIRPRWKRVLDAEENAMGEALGQLFVKEYFDEKAKQRYNDLVEAIRDAYRERIHNLTWMSDSTKQKAYEKLARITKKVGYPDKWKDFSALKIDRGPFVLNVERAAQWWHNYNISKLGKPVDRTEWGITPQTYNAYYNPANNEIVLPAGIFAVPGMRDEELDDAFVYGYAGASTIGHEMTHGFDDQGRRYDAHGDLKNWWQKDDSIQFVERAQKIIRQFNEFNPVDTLHVNGEATQGENIADLGGLLIALDAFKKTAAYQKGEKIGGLTPLQRYFAGYAYGWLYQQRKEDLARQVMTDVHAPSRERVNGPMSNIPEFYEAFDVKPGNKMYRPDSLRVHIW